MKPLCRMARDYGEVASTHARGRHIVAVSGSEAARHVLLTNQDNYAKGIEYELLADRARRRVPDQRRRSSGAASAGWSSRCSPNAT